VSRNWQVDYPREVARLRDELAELLGGVRLGDVVDVAHRRLDVGVTHHRLDVRECERLHGERAEGIPQVVETEPWHTCAIERRMESVAETPVGDVPADRVDEHEIVRVGESVPAGEPVEVARAAWSLTGTDRTRPDFGVPSAQCV
jgi:hypothetical protein